MSQTPRLSIIIPVYKVKRYLKQCVESVLQQTFNDLEIILVDDGSPDACPALCDAYARKDARIRVIHQDNLGLAGARNTGLRRATGDYVGFLDSDDYLEPDAYAKLYAAASKHDADIVFCQAKYFDEKADIIIEANDSSSLPLFVEERFSEDFSWQDVGAENIFSYDSFVVAWNKICRRSFLSDLGADFPPGLIYEDNPFYFQTFFAAQRVCVVRERLITYRINRAGSIIQDVDEGKDTRAIHILAILADIERRLLALGAAETVIAAFHRYAFDEIFHKYSLVPAYLRPKYMALAKGLLPSWLYGKLRLRLGVSALKKTRISSLLSIQREKGRRTLTLLGIFPLASVYKFSHLPGEYDGIVIMEDANTHFAPPAAAVDNREFHCRKLTLASLMDSLSTLISKPACGNQIHAIRLSNADESTLRAAEIASVHGLLAILESMLFVDATSLTEADLRKVWFLYYTLNCIFPKKTIHFVVATVPASHNRMRAVKGLDYEPMKTPSEYDAVARRSRFAEFSCYLAVRVLGIPLIVARKK